MASGDALPIPRKNTAYRVAFPGMKNDGTLITSGTGMDSEVSKDQGTFADCTNEATEIASSSGIYYLDLSSTEMNADMVIVKCTWTNSGALPTVVVLYPQEDVDIRANVVDWKDATAPAMTGDAFARLGSPAGASVSADVAATKALLPSALVSGRMDSSVGAMAANVLTATAIATDAITASKIAADAIGASELAADAVAEIQSGLATSTALATVQADTDDIQTRLPAALVSGRMDASVGAVANNAITAAAIATDAIDADAIKADAVTELQSGLATATAVSSLQTSVDDLPTNSELATALASADDATLAAIAALPTPLNAAGVRTALGMSSANLDTQLGDLPTNSELATALAGADDAVLAAIGGLPTPLDAAGIRAAVGLDDPSLDDQFLIIINKTNNLPGDPASQSSIDALNNLSSAEVENAVWDADTADHADAGSTGEALTAAGSAGDPWTTTLPGSYSAGQAGKIVGDNLNAPVNSRATQTSVDDLPTYSELATALAAADDATLAAIAALPTPLTAAGVRAALGMASANLDTQLDALPTNSELATALASADDATLAAIAALPAPLTAAGVRSALGLASANLDTQLDALPTNAELATTLAAADDATLAAIAALPTPLTAAGVRAALGLASANLDTQLDALPTNAELATALAGADDATLAAIATLNNLSAAQVRTQADAALASYDAPTKAELDAAIATLATATVVSAIKTVTDRLNTALVVDGSVYKFTVNALENAPAGEGGGGGNPWLTDLLAGVDDGTYTLGMAGWVLVQNYLKALLITAGSITVTNPVSAETGDLELVRGDDYTASSGRVLPEWSSEDWAALDLTHAESVTFKAKTRYSSDILTAAVTVVSDTAVRLDSLTHTLTDELAVSSGEYRFDVEAVLASGDIVTLAQGFLNIVEDVR